MLAYAGKQQIDRKTVDLNELIDRLRPVLRANLKPGMELVANTSKLPLVCDVDQTQIEQVLMNLVSNAVQASPVSGQITIKTGHEKIFDVDVDLVGNRSEGGSFNYFEVSDMGMGVTPDEVEGIFEPFYSEKKQARDLVWPLFLGRLILTTV